MLCSVLGPSVFHTLYRGYTHNAMLIFFFSVLAHSASHSGVARAALLCLTSRP